MRARTNIESCIFKYAARRATYILAVGTVAAILVIIVGLLA